MKHNESATGIDDNRCKLAAAAPTVSEEVGVK